MNVTALRRLLLPPLLACGALQAQPPVAPGKPPGPVSAMPVDRELHLVATIDAVQEWKKNDPKYPGEQWSKGKATQRYEIRTRLRSDGRLEVRHLLDPNLDARLEAKTVYLARQAKKYFEREGKPFVLPKTPEERQTFMREMNGRLLACNADLACRFETQMRYASLMAAIDYPEALEDDEGPGRYQYFMPYKGCSGSSRMTLQMTIEGVRYNKSSDKFVPFKETHSADTVNAPDPLPLCTHYTAVIDTQDADKSMWQETVFVPQPFGVTEYTESGHTSRKEEPQPIITAAVDWMNDQLRHAKPEGEASGTLPLVLPLNQNATWLGLWTGTATVHMKWSFRETGGAPGAPPKR